MNRVVLSLRRAPASLTRGAHLRILSCMCTPPVIDDTILASGKGVALAAGLALGAVLCAVQPAIGRDFPDEARLQEIVRTRVGAGGATGIVLGVIEADGTRTIVSSGDAGPNAKPLGPRSVFEIGSITKAFTGILLAQMAARGEVHLEDPVQAYAHEGVTIPDRAGRPITLLDLATHRSSLPRLPGNLRPADRQNPYADYTVVQLHAFLSGYALTRDVGSQYEYSNLGVGLLGHVLAYRAEDEFEPLLRKRVLDPLGMATTAITLTPEMEDWLAVGHAEGRPVSRWDLPTLAGAGALRSNANDLLAFLAANTGAPTSELERAMRDSHQPRRPVNETMEIGLGWHILALDAESRIVWHNGQTGGFRSFVGFDPEREVGVVVLTNSTENTDDIGFHLLNRSIPLARAPRAPEATRDRTEVAVSREVLARHVGVYELTPEFRLTLTLEDEGLHLQATGQAKLRIYPESDRDFFLRGVDAQVTFVIEDGTTSALILHQNGVDQRARKVSDGPPRSSPTP